MRRARSRCCGSAHDKVHEEGVVCGRVGGGWEFRERLGSLPIQARTASSYSIAQSTQMLGGFIIRPQRFQVAVSKSLVLGSHRASTRNSGYGSTVPIAAATVAVIAPLPVRESTDRCGAGLLLSCVRARAKLYWYAHAIMELRRGYPGG